MSAENTGPLSLLNMEPLQRRVLHDLSPFISRLLRELLLVHSKTIILFSIPQSSDQDNPLFIHLQMRVLDTRLASVIDKLIDVHEFVACRDVKIIRNNESSDHSPRARIDHFNMDADLWNATEQQLNLISQAPHNVAELHDFVAATVTYAAVLTATGTASPFSVAIRLLGCITTVTTNGETMKQFVASKNYYVHCVAMFFVRFAVAPEEWPDFFRSYLDDETSISCADNNVTIMTMGELANKLLFEDEVNEAWFPIVDRCILDILRDNLKNRANPTSIDCHSTTSTRVSYTNTTFGFKSLQAMRIHASNLCRLQAAQSVSFVDGLDDELDIAVPLAKKTRVEVPESPGQTIRSVATNYSILFKSQAARVIQGLLGSADEYDRSRGMECYSTHIVKAPSFKCFLVETRRRIKWQLLLFTVHYKSTGTKLMCPTAR